MNKIEKTMNGVMANIPKGIKLAALNGAIIASLLSGCGRTVDTDPVTTPAPTTSIETTIDDPEVDVPVIEDEVTNPVEDNTEVVDEVKLPDPTFVQTGEDSYTVTVDCPDNTNSPELQAVYDKYSDEFPITKCKAAGVSPEVVAAIMAYNTQNNGNPGYINIDAYLDQEITIHDYNWGDEFPYVITANPENYDADHSYVVTRNQYETFDEQYQYIMPFVVQSAFSASNYNLTLSIARLQTGNALDLIVAKCAEENGMTVEQVYASYGIDFVAQYDENGIIDVDYVNGVVSYISGTPTVKNGNVDITYTVDRVKTYGQR